MELYQIASMKAEIPVREYTDRFVDPDRFVTLCRQCPDYGKRWSCPPFAWDPMEFWQKFRLLELHVRILTPREGAEPEQMMKALETERERLFMSLLLREEEFPGSASLQAGPCVLCSDCSRQQGLACRHPHQLRYSIEALGGDVGASMEHFFGKPLVWMKDGALPPYLTLAGGLLRK